MKGSKGIPFNSVLRSKDITDVYEYVNKKGYGRSKKPEDTIMLGLVVSELHIMLYKRMCVGCGVVNVDEIISGLRWQAEERAKEICGDFNSRR